MLSITSSRQQQPKGTVRCGKLNHTPDLEGFTIVNCCSTSSDKFYKQLSPMLLGPYEYQMNPEHDYALSEHKHSKIEKTIQVYNSENLWQFSKVWPGEEEVDRLTGQTRPNKTFFDRRMEGWNDKKAHRWVKKGEKPLYAWWKGQKLDYMQARRAIYCPLYAEKVIHTEGYKKLENLLKRGDNLLILGYDGYDYHAEGMTLDDCFNDVSRPFGHELVLCGLLTGQYVWQ
ncbi:hypothetical protein FDP41_008215 [Naegleria fowleri]|uniref:Uncharacterized protein n=1 Tax=Naegleria fowleri TaxID=5763 RepID=A0A6A5BGA5_NAEFO|nr:uncharacterized protein FDP41_008215 [Naegleria fowleri]KAF0973511.1 hypothetical protein FDP41_008215 [Naegleria fowleri]CAG4716258.1 unnamed protein product [Naegleria fowleri]